MRLLFFWPRIWSFSLSFLNAFEKYAYSDVAGWSVLLMSIRSDWLILLFKCIFLCTCSANYWEKSVEISTCNCGLFYLFSFLLLLASYILKLYYQLHLNLEPLHILDTLILYYSETFLFFFFCLSRAAPRAHGGSPARELHHSHSSARSVLHLRPTPQRTAMLDP